MQTFKVRWTDHYPNRQDEINRQARKMQQVGKVLARQGFILSDTDPSGFLIYIQTPKRGRV